MTGGGAALAAFPCGRRDLGTFFRALWHLGVRDQARRHFWKLIGFAALKGSIAVGLAITLSLMGYHLRWLSREIVAMPDAAPMPTLKAVAAAYPSGLRGEIGEGACDAQRRRLPWVD